MVYDFKNLRLYQTPQEIQEFADRNKNKYILRKVNNKGIDTDQCPFKQDKSSIYEKGGIKIILNSKRELIYAETSDTAKIDDLQALINDIYFE